MLVPFRPDGDHRDAVWSWLRRRWEQLLPDWQIVEGVHDPDDGPWCKAIALEAATWGAEGDVYVVMDADLIIDAEALRAAATDAVWAPWVVPHAKVRRYTHETTQALLEAPPTCEPPDPTTLDVPEQTVCEGGGIVVLTAEAYQRAGGMDPRFRGWGFEDSSWGYQLEALLGPPLCGDHVAWHLWHPTARGQHRRPRAGDGVGGELRKRYQEARSDPAATALLIGERHAIPQPQHR